MEISKISWKEDAHLKCEISLSPSNMGLLTLTIIDDAGNEFEITTPDYSFNCSCANGNIGRSGDKITYVGRTNIYYCFDKVSRVGNVSIQYNGNKVTAVGRTNIYYCFDKVSRVGNVSIQHSGSKVTAVGRAQIQYSFDRITNIRGNVK